MGMQYFGARVVRKEDPALLTGQGQFVADHSPTGTLYAVFVRSPLAHAAIRSIDLSAARALPGVVAALAHDDLPDHVQGARLPLHVPNPAIRKPYTWAPLAQSEVCFVGEPVAVVVAEDPYIAEDAAELVVVDYAELPVVVGLDVAENTEQTSHQDATDNIGAQFTVGFGDVDAAFAEAAHVVSDTFRPHRGAGLPMECRSVLAEPGTGGRTVLVRSATQVPHLVKRSIMDVLALGGDEVQVVAPPDVGGGFGPKAIVYPEEVAVPLLAMQLNRPVKWLEDRREHFLTTTQERDQLYEMELALDQDGRIRGIRGRMRHDAGAYFPWGIITPYISSTTLPGPYVVPAYQLDVTCLLTNTVPLTPTRGAGRPQAVFVMERLLDHAAAELGMDRADIRRVNLVPAERMPYEAGLTFRDGSPVVYDSGDYPATLEAALDKAGYDGFRDRQRRARAEGRLIGIGMAFYVEGTGLGPFEGANVEIHRNGKATVYTSAAPQGQSHHTTLAQLAADQLGLDVDDVTVSTGDTSTVPIGIGTFASRVAVNAGSSVHLAATRVREKVVALTAALLEAAEDDIELVDGAARVKGSPDTAMTFAELAKVSQGMPGFALPPGQEPGLFAESYFTPERSTYSHGCHLVEVELDRDTGRILIQRYVVAHDCGKIINPMVVDGQIQGGVAHGVGNALLEYMAYDEQGQPVTASFADYLLPEAVDVPRAEVIHLESPTPLNPLGVKGAGEGGTIPAAAAIVSAIQDALHGHGPRINHHPVTPAFVLPLLDEVVS